METNYDFKKRCQSNDIFSPRTGNMWAQSWTNIARFVMPFPDMPDFDVTDSMQENVRGA